MVVLSDGSQTDAEIVGADPDSDLAIIRIIDDEVRPPPVALGDSDAITPGQLAVAIGDPFSRGFSMTSGIISAVGRTINPTDSNFSVPRVIQHDAATNPGNSGGPLLNRYGEVIGINTQIISETGAFSGIGLAVPINLARLVAPALIEDGRYEYPYIGIRGTTLGPDIASAMGLPDDTRGALVLAVSADSAAQRAGLQPANQTTVVDGLETADWWRHHRGHQWRADQGDGRRDRLRDRTHSPRRYCRVHGHSRRERGDGQHHDGWSARITAGEK